jgi:hypothetical protein
LGLLEPDIEDLPKNRRKGIILDKGYDADEDHEDIYEFFDIIPIIIRKKMVYPKGFSKDGYPLCRWGFSMKPKSSSACRTNLTI